MINKIVTTAICAASFAAGGWAQSVPLYRVTVVDRSVSAVDYQYRSGPTMIDFRGTVLLPAAKGEAIVESKQGRTEVDARFDRLSAPTRYGREYLTYVLWAISPEGHPKNLGEILPGSSDKAHLRVTTDLQAFGLIVTAEPYAAVRQPSDVVVLENQLKPGTIGRTEPIQAKYELLPRGHYTYHVPESTAEAEGNGPMLSRDEYQQVVQLYEAQNALQMAESAGATQYASDTYNKAADLLRQAKDAQARKSGVSTVVTLARQASQTAEDSRILAVQRKQQDEMAAAQDQASRAEAARAQAEAAAQTAQAQAAASRALLEQERAARQQSETQAATPPEPPPAAPPPQAAVQPPTGTEQQKADVRIRLFGQLNAVMPALDTPRGLVVTLPGSDFHEAKLARIAAAVTAQPGLMVAVEGYGPSSEDRAYAVRSLLVEHGIPDSAISARGLGDTRPIASNATAAGREQNRRVEIVISGKSIGELPHWSKAYSVMPRRETERPE